MLRLVKVYCNYYFIIVHFIYLLFVLQCVGVIKGTASRLNPSGSKNALLTTIVRLKI